MKFFPLTALLTALTLTLTGAPAHAATPSATAPATAARTATATASAAGASQVATMRRLINQARRRAGLRPLRANGTLRRAAALKLGRIAACGQFTHTPCGAPFTTTFRAAGWNRGTMGENIAFGGAALGTPAAIFNSWMHSPGHRANIMSRAFRYEGLAVHSVALPGIGAVRVWVNTFGS